MNDFRTAQLSEADRTMLEFAEALTLEPGAMSHQHIQRLRDVGFGDTAIHDIVQVTALFAYYNRLADGLGIDDEPEWQAGPQDDSLEAFQPPPKTDT